jgi:hypothetical protein
VLHGIQKTDSVWCGMNGRRETVPGYTVAHKKRQKYIFLKKPISPDGFKKNARYVWLIEEAEKFFYV